MAFYRHPSAPCLKRAGETWFDTNPVQGNGWPRGLHIVRGVSV